MLSKSIVHITLVKYRGYCMTARGKQICYLDSADSISHEELSEDEIPFSKRPDDVLFTIYGCRWNVKI